MGLLNWWGRMEKWMHRDKANLMMTTTADIILFVGYEHFLDKIDLSPYAKCNKFVCWTYESLTDPYGANGWRESIPQHFLSKNQDFLTGFTRYNDKNLDRHFKPISYVFCADELDCNRFKNIGKRTSWMPFGVDPNMFNDAPILNDGRSSNVSFGSTPPAQNKSMNPRKIIKQGVRSGRNVSRVKYDVRNKSTKIERAAMGVSFGRQDISGMLRSGRGGRRQNVGCFVGTKSNVRVAILNRLGLGLATMQTKRKGKFSDEHVAVRHTSALANSYKSYLMSFNLRSIFAGVTPRAVESMACGCLLFQYKCAPNRPKSGGLYNNCIKYEIMTEAGLKRVREQYHHFVANPQDAINMGKKAREEVMANHTIQHRINRMIANIRKK